MRLSRKWYDRAKNVALVVLPGLATLVLAVGNIWEYADAEKVAATITAVDAFLGILLKISSSNYQSEVARFWAHQEALPGGTLYVDPRPGHEGMLNIELDQEQDAYVGQDQLVLKVQEVALPPPE